MIIVAALQFREKKKNEVRPKETFWLLQLVTEFVLCLTRVTSPS